MASIIQVRHHVITTVRNYCLAGTSLTDDDIARVQIGELPLFPSANISVPTPMEGLAMALQVSLGVPIPSLTEEWLNQRISYTVSQIAHQLYNTVLAVE